jgi:putative tricarboxylic transport membrane protein
MRRAMAALPIGLLGLAAVLLARDFPPIPGQAYGPALFPTVLGLGLLVAAAAVALQAPPARPERQAGGSRLAAVGCAVAPVVVMLAWDAAGWPLTAWAVAAVLLILAGARPLVALAVGFGVAALTWVLFSMLLRVPLPRGPLDFLPY